MHMADMELLSAACCIVALDGQVGEREMKIVRAIAEKAGVSDFYLSSLLDQAKRDKEFYQQQFRIALGDPVKTVRNLLIVAAADGKVAKEELAVLHHFCDKLGVARKRFDDLIVELKGQVRAHRREHGKNPDDPSKPLPGPRPGPNTRQLTSAIASESSFPLAHGPITHRPLLIAADGV